MADEDEEDLLERVHGLSDIELAALLSLVTREHCIISTPEDSLDDLIEELQLISANTLGLTYAIIDCNSHTTLEDFATSLLLQTPSPPTPSPQPRSTSPYHTRATPPLASPTHDYFLSNPAAAPRSPLAATSPTARAGSTAGSSAIVNVVLARRLDRAPRAVQIQALELLRTRRIFTRTSVHAAPKQFLFVPVLVDEEGAGVPGGDKGLTPHLNDYFHIAHWHDPEDGFTNLEGEEDGEGGQDASGAGEPLSGLLGGYQARDGPSRADVEAVDDEAETSSVSSIITHRRPSTRHRPILSPLTPSPDPLIPSTLISQLSTLTHTAHISIECTRYLHNIASHIRLHRALSPGGAASPLATRHFAQLARALAPLHRLDFVTPGLVALAAKKVYPHRLRVVENVEKERSMQWGSEKRAVEVLLEGVTARDVVEDVLGMLPPPL